MSTNSSGTGDPLRLLTLLWNPSQRAGRSGIDVRSITRAAISLADDRGLDALTMRNVAERMGVGAMSLYTHVPGKTELVELMIDAVAGDIYADGELPAQHPAWQDGLRHVAERNWHHHLDHPWTVEVVPGRPTLGPGITSKYDAELAPLDAAGLSDPEMDRLLAAILGLVEACARSQIGLDRVRANVDDHEWWDNAGPALSQAMKGQRFPLAERVGAAAGQQQGAGNPYATMHLALNLITDGIEPS